MLLSMKSNITDDSQIGVQNIQFSDAGTILTKIIVSWKQTGDQVPGEVRSEKRSNVNGKLNFLR